MTGTIIFGEHDKPNRYFLDNIEVSEREFRQGFPDQEGVPGGHRPSCWPQVSEALACHPDQVGEMNERNRSKGLGTRYNPDGSAVIPDRFERKKLLKAEGFFDKNGGYGD